MQYGFTRHARQKLRTLGLHVDDVLAIVRAGDVIENSPERGGHLLYGSVGHQEIHVAVVSDDATVTLVTTVYSVDRRSFPDGRTRRRHR